jgi:hypothetical protein
LGTASMGNQCTPLDEVRRLLVVFKRKLRDASQREPSCSDCYRKVLEMIGELEARLEEYEYEEALKRWG